MVPKAWNFHRSFFFWLLVFCRMTESSLFCFCGGPLDAPTLHPDYRVCRDCGSAVLLPSRVADLSAVTDDATHLYGKAYWDEHQTSLGLPPLEVRARTDLSDRCQYWLAHLLRRRLPPGSLLELGCSHGGFVKLLGSAGFTAVGMEMSPAVAAASRERFGVAVHLGPLETTAGNLGRFDGIVLYDVFEHVSDPAATLRGIVDHLNEDGIVVIQTPRHDGITDPGWPMYLPPEHTFLFSSAGLTRLLTDAGLTHVEFETPIFDCDQFVVASRRPIPTHSEEAVVAALTAVPEGRLVLAMLDMYRKLRILQNPDPAARFGLRELSAALCRAVPRAIARKLVRVLPTGIRRAS
jgi:SAM-dependent methyltransferase